MTETPDIIYTKVDESPELASASLLPIIRSFASAAAIDVETRDISLAGRVLAAFSDRLPEEQRVPDHLAELGELVKTKDANVIKLPNISASVPQLMATIKELQAQGFALPDYPEEPQTDDEKEARARYDAVKGSAVNPVLREGNSDRRAAKAVKSYAMKNPHSMGSWSADSKTHVAAMPGNDFFENEKSATITAAQAGGAKIVFTDTSGNETVLKDSLKYIEGEVVDATYLSARALRAYIADQIAATDPGVLFSVHLKATMMKVSDPIIFGHFVSVYLEDFINKHAAKLDDLGWNPNDGIGDLEARIEGDSALQADLAAAMAARPPLYMVDSDKGITNLHVPSDVIIDASMPAAIRAGGKGWGPDGKEADLKCCIPDNSYAPVYDETIEFFKANGALDPTTAGAVSNVGLMAQKAEEYGSHPTTFELGANGTVRIVLDSGDVLHEHAVEKGDIWRSATAKKAPIVDWIQLGIDRFNATGLAAFWLDPARAHDAELIKYITPALAEAGVDIPILAPRDATRFTLTEQRKGNDVVTITGNVLRDYLTDLFPILELGTSAKMLSIVKLMHGGGMFETGAGGSAPKHVTQLVAQNHLRWDSLGEFCALGESFKYLAEARGKTRAQILGDAVDEATQKVLENGQSPQYKPGQNDNRTSHFYFALYWAEALAAQTDDAELAAHFGKISSEMAAKEDTIVAELMATQGEKADIGGYYHPDPAKLTAVMRPSLTLNAIIG
jgi:isocitrate dehydrogenase